MYKLSLEDPVNPENSFVQEYEMGVDCLDELVRLYDKLMVEMHLSNLVQVYGFQGKSSVDFDIPNYGIVKVELIRM